MPAADQLVGALTTLGSQPRERRLQVGGGAAYFVLLTLLFTPSLARLGWYAAHSDLHSHILLIPFIFAYLLHLKRRRRATAYRSSSAWALALATTGMAALAAAYQFRGRFSLNDGLALVALAYVSFVASGGFVFFGSKWMAARAFPFFFLIFMVPMPDAAVNWLEHASASASADVAAQYFDWLGTALVRHGTVFELPGIVIQVARECSGIHSSWILFISSLLAAHVFLRTRWRKIVLVAFVIPLGIVRNGFRILVIGLLCVNYGPQMIDSPIHHRGGPLFFALSLVPFFLLVWSLRRQERGLSRPAEDS